MFDTLTGRLDGIFKKLRSRGKLHPKQVDNALTDMRTALLDADVAVEVADDLLTRVRGRALSDEVMKSLTPAQQVVKVVRDELQTTMGGTQTAFTLPSSKPAVVMMAGVQGSGKTTASAKLALHIRSKGKRPLLAAADLWRPAAVEQLVTLGSEIGVDVVSDGKDAVKVAKSALKHADREGYDVLIIDTAGRLHVDEEMMREARKVKDAARPHHVLMACDAMTGQDAVVQARAFMREIDTTGFVLTKLDGDARGGAALSITEVTGRPVFFVGTGEKPEDLEPFYPDRMASRIMGMGDVLSLIDKAQEGMDAEKAAEAAEKLASARFTLEDFLTQMQEVRKLGSLQDILAMLPARAGRQERAQGRADRRRADRAGGGDHPIDDPGGATRTRYHRRVPAPADRAGVRRDHRGRERPAEGVRAGPEADEEHAGWQTDAPDPRDAEPPGDGVGARDGRTDQVEEAGREEAPVLPRRRGRSAEPARRPVHREHRHLPAARGPVGDPDRRRPRVALAPRRRATVEHGPGVDEQGRHLGHVLGGEGEPQGGRRGVLTDVRDLLEFIARELVDEPDAVRVEEVKDDRGVLLTLRVAPDDMGKVIGRGGRTARAIRSVVKAGGLRAGIHHVGVEIVD